MRQADIDVQPLAGQRDLRHGRAILGQEGRVIASIRIQRDRDGLDRAQDRAVHNSLYMPDLGQEELTRFHDLHALGILDRLPAMFGFEAGVLRAPLEEIHKGARQVQADGLMYANDSQPLFP
jgi:hypothetical protein